MRIWAYRHHHSCIVYYARGIDNVEEHCASRSTQWSVTLGGLALGSMEWTCWFRSRDVGRKEGGVDEA